MTQRPKVLFVAPVEPWCRENGSSLITADLLDALASLEDVELLPIFVRRPPPGYERHPPDGMEGILLDIPGLPRWVSVVLAAVRWSSPHRQRFDHGRVARRVQKVLTSRGFEPDLVHVEHLPLVDIGLRLARFPRRPLVYRAHNVESRLWARRLHMLRGVGAPLVTHMERREEEAVRSADLTLCISEADLQWARACAPAEKSELLPCTLRVERFDRVATGPTVFGAQVCFVGGLDWAPNENGLRWFVDEVLPRINQRLPDAGLVVLARGASDRPWLRNNRLIRILPPEACAAELFASSHVSIAPLFQGGGVRIKIPESLALECPVVATVIGAEGHDLPGLTRTDDSREFADACVRHLTGEGDDPSGVSLRASVEARYGAVHQARRLVELWRGAIQRVSGTG